MDQRHLKLPVDLSSFLTGDDMPKCRQGAESIAQHIQLLLTTRPGENRYDADYGCSIWDLDFELIISEGTWKEKFRLAVMDAILNYERRLEQVYVEVNLNAVERFGLRKRPEVRRKAVVFVKAQLVETGEQFSFKTELYLSPLTVE
jgi:phage baseplate assembly protein W